MHPDPPSIPPPAARLRDLLEHPPRNSGELQLRLRGVDPHGLGTRLVHALREGSLDVARHPWLLEALSLVGVEPHWGDLEELFVAPGTPPRVRALVQAALMQADPERAAALTRTLPPSIMFELMAGSVASLITHLEEGSARSESLADLLQELPPQEREPIFGHLEQLRAETTLSAAAAWGPILRRRGLRALHRQVLDAVVQDGGSEAEELLSKLQAHAGSKKERRLYGKALMTVRTRDIERRPAVASHAGRCWASPCDGQGAFVAMMASKGRRGRLTISDIVVRTAAEVRDGFLILEAEEDDLEELLDELRGRLGVKPAPLPEVAALVMQGLRRGKAAGKKLSKDTRLGLRAFEKMHRKSRVELEPLPVTAPAEPVRYRQLLARPEHRAWFLDSGDLLGQGIEAPPRDEGASRRWLDDAARRLQDSSVQARLLAMTDYQARWYRWIGQEELAGVCAAAHTELGGDLEQSPFLAAFLGRSAGLLDDEDDVLDVSRLGDPYVRSDLRARFFSGVVAATSRDLARLDYTEAADIALDGAVKALPGELRPAADPQRELAYQLACLFVDELLGPPPEEHFIEAAAALLVRELELDLDDAEDLAEDVFDDLEGFQDEICDICPVGCISGAEQDLTGLFHSAQYPPWLDEED